MKKLLSLFLAAFLLLPVLPAHAFTDISLPQQSYSAESLASIGILSSVDRYNPNNSLTRAEFCKTAVISMGFNEESLYRSMTIFPDVPHTAWYSPYVNAAVRKYKVITGYGNGTFCPEQNITFGEASTILLKLLGYETADIGPFWPRDFVLKAQQIGLCDDMSSISAASAISRGNAAIMLRNLMLMNKKDGTPYIAGGFTAGTSDTILCATWETDPRLSRGQVRLYSGDKESIVTSFNDISSSLVGLRGMPVYDKNNASRLIGFIADTAGVSSMKVKSATADKLETAEGELSIPRGTKIVVNGMVTDYSTGWFDVRKDSEIMVYMDNRGQPSLITVRQGTLSAYSSVMINGVDQIIFTSGSKIIKDGATVTVEALNPYDVVAYSPKENTYYASGERITLLYEKAEPTYTSPEKITAGGVDFTISENAAKYFKSLKLNTTITLLLDNSGNVAAAFESSKVSGKAKGILTELSDASATIELFNGHTLKGAPSMSASDTVSTGAGVNVSALYKSLGRLVTVTQDKNGKLNIYPVSMATSGGGAIDPTLQTIGKKPFSPSIRIFEEPAPGLPLIALTISDLGKTALPSSYIKHIELDGAGNVTLLVLQNITGNGFTYGMVSESSGAVSDGTGLDGNPITRTKYYLTMQNSEGVKKFESFYSAGLSNSSAPAAIATGTLKNPHSFSTPAFVLKSTATVGRDDFDAFYGARVNGVFIPVGTDVQVYATSLDRFIPLSEARANFTSFQLYCDRDPQYGGTVRMIIAK